MNHTMNNATETSFSCLEAAAVKLRAANQECLSIFRKMKRCQPGSEEWKALNDQFGELLKKQSAAINEYADLADKL